MPANPTKAFDLLWQVIDLAPTAYERVDDSRGEVGDVFLDWAELHGAAGLVETRTGELADDLYDVPSPAADALRDAYPLAAVPNWSAMIGHVLNHGRSSRYRHAANHLRACAREDRDMTDDGSFPPHDIYVQSLRTRHERKASFRSRMDKRLHLAPAAV